MLKDMKDENRWDDCKKHFIKEVKDGYGTRKMDILIFNDSIRCEIESDNPHLKAMILSNKEVKRIFREVKPC